MTNTLEIQLPAVGSRVLGYGTKVRLNGEELRDVKEVRVAVTPSNVYEVTLVLIPDVLVVTHQNDK